VLSTIIREVEEIISI